eukprot:7909651-Pyramimonas_sp.AAC.1
MMNSIGRPRLSEFSGAVIGPQGWRLRFFHPYPRRNVPHIKTATHCGGPALRGLPAGPSRPH